MRGDRLCGGDRRDPRRHLPLQRLPGPLRRPLPRQRPGKAEDFHLLRGTPKLYVKTAESGARRAQAFCPDCGSPLYATDADKPVVLNIRLGGVRQRAQIVPQRQIWCESALDWAMDISGIPGVAKQTV